jgi:hypothetical protein
LKFLTALLALVALNANAQTVRSTASAYEISTTTRVAFTSASTVSAAIMTSSSQFWYFQCDSKCHIALGSSPTATSQSFPLPADLIFGMPIHDNTKVAVTRDSTDGNLYITKGLK